MSQQSKYAEMDLKQAINVFTKTLLWKLHEGHPVANEELEALNSLRANAGMGAIEVPKSEEPKPQQKLDGAKPRKQLSEPTEKETGMVVHIPSNAKRLPDNDGWKNRMDYTSDSGNTYRIAQNKDTGAWGCTCWPYKKGRNCGHLRDLGLSSQPNTQRVTLKAGSKTAAEMGWSEFDKQSAELMHSDNDLAMKMEPAVAGEVHIDGPEAGPSNDELHASGHSENGENGSPMFDGDMKSPERQNVNAIREALETQVEMEVGKPIQQKQEEVKVQEKARDAAMMNPAATGGAAEVTAKPGTQIVINISGKKLAGEYANWCDPCIMRLHPDVMMSHAPGHGTTGKCERCGNNSELRTVKTAVAKIAYVSHCPGHTNSKGESAPWCIRQHNTDKILESFHSKSEAETGLKNMESHRGSVKEAEFREQRVQISEGSGLDSGKEGVVIPWDDPRASDVMQDYPFVGGRNPQTMGWIAIALDDGEITTVPRNRAMVLKRSAEPIGGEPEMQSGATSGHGGGMFGGTDLEGPSFHVGFTIGRTRREASFRSFVETAKFVKDASVKFGAKDWTMKGAAVDQAKRQLVLEWLKTNNLTTGEIEKRLGGGKYSNIAYPILHELAKEGLVSHKKMRWSLKNPVPVQSETFKAGSKVAGEGMAKTEAELEKEAGFNFFFPGQVLQEFYPELQHEIVDYPNARNDAMGLETPDIVGDGGHELEGVLDDALDTTVVEMIQLPADISDPISIAAADYSSTSPAGGMGIGRDGKPEVLEGAPLRKENDIRGYMFTDEFYGQYDGIPGAALAVASQKTAADGEEKSQFARFLKMVCGEIAATMVAAFKVTQRPLLDKVPGVGELQLDTIEQGSAAQVTGQTSQGGRMKYILSKLNDSDVKAAINDAWAQAAVWNDSTEGGFVYEVFVRPETIDTDSMKLTYKFVAGTRE